MRQLTGAVLCNIEASVMESRHTAFSVLNCESCEIMRVMRLKDEIVCSPMVNMMEIGISWNYKHIGHSQKIPRYNVVNEIQGYRPLAIYSPQEVINYDEEGF